MYLNKNKLLSSRITVKKTIWKTCFVVWKAARVSDAVSHIFCSSYYVSCKPLIKFAHLHIWLSHLVLCNGFWKLLDNKNLTLLEKPYRNWIIVSKFLMRYHNVEKNIFGFDTYFEGFQRNSKQNMCSEVVILPARPVSTYFCSF